MLHFMEPAPRIAIILARLSDLRDDDERGVDGQRSSAGSSRCRTAGPSCDLDRASCSGTGSAP